VEREKPLPTFFYRSASGSQPVREWLQTLSKADKLRIGADIWKIQSEWPIGMPHVRAMGNGLYEIRSNLHRRIARVLFTPDGDSLVLLHGFIKKTQQTPPEELALALKRKRDYEQT